MLKAILTLVFFVLFQANASAQAKYFAIAQFDNQAGAKLLWIQGFNKAKCDKLIETFHAGLRVDCPQCTKDYGSCTQDIGQYKNVWQNKKHVIPYVSTGNIRMMMTGLPRTYINKWCDELAAWFKDGGRKAICIK